MFFADLSGDFAALLLFVPVKPCLYSDDLEAICRHAIAVVFIVCLRLGGRVQIHIRHLISVVVLFFVVCPLTALASGTANAPNIKLTERADWLNKTFTNLNQLSFSHFSSSYDSNPIQVSA